MDITLGYQSSQFPLTTDTRIVSTDPYLSKHLSRPWFQAYLQDHVGQPLSMPAAAASRARRISLPSWVTARPTAIAGKSGFGKSRLAENILTNLITSGSSLFLIDAKGETVRDIFSLCPSLGINQNDVILIDPSRPDLLPGWNPFLVDIDPLQTAGDFTAVVEALSSGPSPRARDLVLNAVYIMAVRKLSPYHLGAFLQRKEYREAVLSLPAPVGSGAAYHQAVSYFRNEFGNWSKAEQSTAISVPLNRIRELVKSDSLLLMLSSDVNSFDMSDLFFGRKIVLVFLDSATLGGDQAARLLGGILINGLFRTASRLGGLGPVPCTLFIDELIVLEKLSGSSSALVQLLCVGRSLKLPTCCAFQFASGLSDELRAAIFGNASAFTTFQLAYEDARIISTSLAAGRAGAIERVEVRMPPVKKDEDTPIASWAHPVLDADGKYLRLNDRATSEIKACSNGKSQLAYLKKIGAGSYASRLYVLSPISGRPVHLDHYIHGLEPHEFMLRGPRLSLSTMFPRPHIGTVSKTTDTDYARLLAKTIQELPVQHCLTKVGTDDPTVIKVADVHIPPYDRAAWRSTSPSAEALRLIERLEHSVQRCSLCDEGGSDDGSIR